MESAIVIKVKYGKILRRFSARVNENGQLDLNMYGLREKVLSLFNFAPDVDVRLTYIDEDGDIVTLVDEEDLRDVMRQSLNPLRITLKFDADNGSGSHARYSGNFTPMRSPQEQLQNVNTVVDEMLRSVPDPVRERLSKLSHDLASKATSTAPGIAEFVEWLSKMGQSYRNSVFADSSSCDGDSQSITATLQSKCSEAKKDDDPASNKKSDFNLAKKSSGLVRPASGSVNLNILPGSCNVTFDDNMEEVKKSGECDVIGKSEVEHKVPAGDNSKQGKRSSECHLGCKSVGFGTYKNSAGPAGHCHPDSQTDSGANRSKKFPSPLHLDPNPFDECPFSQMHLANDSNATAQFAPHVRPFKRSYYRNNGTSRIFHRGVRCDGCGVHPIIGPRFKSKVKEDYDLCSICFLEMGNEADYIRIERPVFYNHPWPFTGLNDHQANVPPTLPRDLTDWMMKSNSPKLDSRFIQDVTIMDGTVMAPSTPFTKIWRMRNSGSSVWSQGTQLAWIGGDKFSESLLVDVEIPVDGFPMDKELDIAVNFTTPQRPGRYISYWRMVSPSGQRFGQRVWVFIQVETAANESSGISFHGFNLNLPPDSDGITGPEIKNVSLGAIEEGSILERDTPSEALKSVKSIGEEDPNKDQDLNFPVNDILLVGDVSDPDQAEPIIELPEEVATRHLDGPYPVTDASLSAQEVVRDSSDIEEKLLRELEEMGFKQVDLNKEILRMNAYDLEQSVDDLCSVTEWDPILEELQEMGFCDNEMNKRLLQKNNGSVKHVVMDLIAGEK